MGPTVRDEPANLPQTSMGQVVLSHGVISSCNESIGSALVPCKRMP